MLILVSTTIGGLLAGIIAYKLAHETEGHGTDKAISAFHNKNGKIRKRVPVVKAIASSLTIGSGGSGGREGPTDYKKVTYSILALVISLGILIARRIFLFSKSSFIIP